MVVLIVTYVLLRDAAEGNNRVIVYQYGVLEFISVSPSVMSLAAKQESHDTLRLVESI